MRELENFMDRSCTVKASATGYNGLSLYGKDNNSFPHKDHKICSRDINL
jgi:hypothetical protein